MARKKVKKVKKKCQHCKVKLEEGVEHRESCPLHRSNIGNYKVSKGRAIRKPH